jgi:hypothetical protein
MTQYHWFDSVHADEVDVLSLVDVRKHEYAPPPSRSVTEADRLNDLIEAHRTQAHQAWRLSELHAFCRCAQVPRVYQPSTCWETFNRAAKVVVDDWTSHDQAWALVQALAARPWRMRGSENHPTSRLYRLIRQEVTW